MGLRAVGRRAARWALLLLLWFAGLSVSSVLALRWVPPLGSALMVEDAAHHWLNGDFDFRLH